MTPWMRRAWPGLALLLLSAGTAVAQTATGAYVGTGGGTLAVTGLGFEIGNGPTVDAVGMRCDWLTPRTEPTDPAWQQIEADFRDARCLRLPLRRDALPAIHDWLVGCSCLHALGPAPLEIAELCLYGLAANIIEHGHGVEAEGEIRIAWRPDPDRPGSWFLITDRGRAHDPADWRLPDLNDPQVRRQGRGFGLSIVHAAMRKVSYLPGAPSGNLTLLRFEPGNIPAEEETSHV